MARFDDGINGPFRGKVGSVIGSKWRKINYMKGLSRIKKRRPPSPEQALIQKKFSRLNDFLKPLSRMLEISFNQFTDKATGRNAAFSYNYDEAFIVEGDEVRLNYPALRFSHGSLVTAGAERAWLDDGVVSVSWNTKTYGLGGAPDDEAYVLLFDETHDTFRMPDKKAIRQDGHVEYTKLKRGTPVSGPYHLWMFFVDSSRKRVSKTVYIPIQETAEN